MDNQIMARVCEGLAQVCEGLAKKEVDNIKRLKLKMKLHKEVKKILKTRTLKKVKDELKECKNNYKKYEKDFKKKAKVFRNFAKILENDYKSKCKNKSN